MSTIHAILAFETARRAETATDRKDKIDLWTRVLELAELVEVCPFDPRDLSILRGTAYFSRANAIAEPITLGRVDDLEKAIDDYDKALKAFANAADVERWARAQMNRANVFAKQGNLEKAIEGFHALLDVAAEKGMPDVWARTQLNLAIAYSESIRGEYNLDDAIEKMNGALEVFTRKNNPEDWATVQRARAQLYQKRSRGRGADDLEKAIEGYDDALKVFTEKATPPEWALTEMYRATAYTHRIKGVLACNLRKAIKGHKRALKFFTRKRRPEDHLKTKAFLGATYMKAGKWALASTALTEAFATADTLIGKGLNTAEALSIIEATARLGANAALAAAMSGDKFGALEALERGRARHLAIALSLDLIMLSEAEGARLYGLRRKLHEAERELEKAMAGHRREKLDRVDELRRELEVLVEEGRTATEAAEPSFHDRVTSLTDENCILVAPALTDYGAVALLAANGDVTTIELADDTKTQIFELLGARKDEADLCGWEDAYLKFREDNSNSAPLLDEIKRIGPRLWDALIASIVARALDEGDGPNRQVVVLPQSALGLLPVALAQDPAEKKPLLERCELSFVPSLKGLEISRTRAAQVRAHPKLATIVNPTEDPRLKFTAVEAAFVQTFFDKGRQRPLAGKDATKSDVLELLKGADYWHFSCHAFFNPLQPRNSGLKLANDEVMTIGDLLDNPGLGNPRLVVLSACETGLYDISRAPDEFVGLPTSFLQAGAAGVIATLWPVNDSSATLLMMHFYEHHLSNKRLRPAAALRDAQLWLRDATVRDLRKYAKDQITAGRITQEDGELTRQTVLYLADFDLDRCLFDDPYHWGGWAHFGA